MQKRLRDETVEKLRTGKESDLETQIRWKQKH